ncbi:hypothetical protein [Clostridium oceanicum]|uniref:Uncharacterized protein n=1 Tax=Clostridium oceanicum TaxID=1543 RepID=A0ABP3V3I9_9CLOT
MKKDFDLILISTISPDCTPKLSLVFITIEEELQLDLQSAQLSPQPDFSLNITEAYPSATDFIYPTSFIISTPI